MATPDGTVPAQSPAPEAPGKATAHPVDGSRRSGPSGWYVAGLCVQCLLWVLVFLGLTLAVLGGSVVNEFRYVGF